MKIVVTNPSGLAQTHIKELEQFGEVIIHNDTTNDNYEDRLRNADIAVIDCFITPVNTDLLKKSPDLKFFSINSTGFDKVDVKASKDMDIVASNVPHFSTDSVAELAIGLMFDVNRKITLGDKEFRRGLNEVDPGTSEQLKFCGFNLANKTLGVVGLGDIGSRVAQIGNGLGMSAVGYNRTNKELPDVEYCSLEDLFSRSDVVVLCLALNDQTKGIVSKALIESMKTTSIFISIASLELLDQEALKNALNNNLIAGAGFDTASDDWIGVKNTIFTPHIGYDTFESQENMGRIITDNIKAYLNGDPINQIA